MAESHKAPSGAVRAWLRDALDEWQREGLLTGEAAGTLRQRYQLDVPGRSAGQILSIVVLSIGGLLLGGGIMALVAANWQDIPASLKLGGLGVLLIGLHLVGFRHLRRGNMALGQGLILAACVCFGGGIGLVAQVFQLTSESGFGVLLWAIGALAVAWAAPSMPSALLALAITVFWFLSKGQDLRHYPWWSVLATPFATLALYGGLGLIMRSRALTAMGAFVGAMFLGFATQSLAGVLCVWVGGAVAGGLLVWALGEAIAARGVEETLSAAVGGGGGACMGVAAYVGSYHWFYEYHSYYRGGVQANLPAAIACLAIVVVLVGVILADTWRRARPQGSRRIVLQCIVGGVACLIVAGLLALALAEGATVLCTIIANAGGVALAVAAIASGFTEARRGNFWAGTCLLVLLVVSRFFEYETDLMLKAMIFMACGVVVIYGGIEYERALAKRALAGKEEAAGDFG